MQILYGQGSELYHTSISPMSILSSNYHDIGVALIIRSLKDMCVLYKPQILYLMETKAKKKKIKKIKRKLGFRSSVGLLTSALVEQVI